MKLITQVSFTSLKAKVKTWAVTQTMQAKSGFEESVLSWTNMFYKQYQVSMALKFLGLPESLR